MTEVHLTVAGTISVLFAIGGAGATFKHPETSLRITTAQDRVTILTKTWASLGVASGVRTASACDLGLWFIISLAGSLRIYNLLGQLFRNIGLLDNLGMSLY